MYRSTGSKYTPHIISNITAKAGAQISVLLPQNTIIDLDTLALYAGLNISTGSGPPRNAESLIYSIQVTVNGQVIQNPCMNLNLLFNTLYDLQAGAHANNLQNVLSLGAHQVTPSASNAIWPGAQSASNVSAPNTGPIVIPNLLGFQLY